MTRRQQRQYQANCFEHDKNKLFPFPQYPNTAPQYFKYKNIQKGDNNILREHS